MKGVWRVARLTVVVFALAGVAAFFPGRASADQVGTVTLNGYGGADHTYTTENSYQLYNNAGSNELFLSIYPADFFTTYQRIDIYFFVPGSLAPGTYLASGGFGSLPGLVMQDWVDNAFCYGGSFTIDSINQSNPWGLEFDISWSQPDCGGSGHGEFTAFAPPDTTPPIVQLPVGGWVVAETAGDGTTVYFEVTATDDRDPNPQVTCDPPSGSYFELGLSYVYCTATDNAGNTSPPTLLIVNVVPPDTTPPIFTWIPDFDVAATDPSGAHVDLYVMATDDRGYVTVSCLVQPGEIAVDPYGWYQFPINAPGTSTTVSCTATDFDGNQTTASFDVHVRGAPEQTGDLIATVNSYGLIALGRSLQDKLTTVQQLLATNRKTEACEKLNAFTQQVKAQDGKALADWQAWTLIAAAVEVKTVIGC